MTILAALEEVNWKLEHMGKKDTFYCSPFSMFWILNHLNALSINNKFNFWKLKSKVWKIYNRNQKFTYKRIRFKLLNKIDMLNHISMKCWDSQMLSNWIYHLWVTNLKKHGIPLLNTGFLTTPLKLILLKSSSTTQINTILC